MRVYGWVKVHWKEKKRIYLSFFLWALHLLLIVGQWTSKFQTSIYAILLLSAVMLTSGTYTTSILIVSPNNKRVARLSQSQSVTDSASRLDVLQINVKTCKLLPLGVIQLSNLLSYRNYMPSPWIFNDKCLSEIIISILSIKDIFNSC